MTRSIRYISLGFLLCASALAHAQEAAPEKPATKTFNSTNGSTDVAATSGSSLTTAAPRHRLDAGVFLGGNYFSNELELGNAFHDDQVPTSAFLLGVRGTYQLLPELMPGHSLDPALSVELEAKLALSSTRGNTELMRASHSAPVLGWRASAMLSVWNKKTITPFAVLGLGGETAFSSSPFVYSVDTDAQLHWGLGATYRIHPDYGVRADFRHGITAGRFALAASTVEFHVGFYYRFGFGAAKPEPEPKPDPKVVVEPLPDPEPPKAVDTDGDGINDDVDQCPNRKELVNQIKDEDGCPEADTDGDKIIDEQDKCPNEAEDPDEYQDEDGCPDRDDDGDGRPDAIDECPNKPEVLNGFEDDDGCPEEIPDDVKQAIQSIFFRPRSARLNAIKPRLAQLAAVLKAHPSIRLRIAGHTDNREKKAQKLSEDRANAVKAHLVGEGIDAARLETAGYGATQPIVSNRTRAGKARNRRVDFELIPGQAQLPDPTAPTPKTPAAGAAEGTDAANGPAAKDPAVKDPAAKDPAVKDPAANDPSAGATPGTPATKPPAPAAGGAAQPAPAKPAQPGQGNVGATKGGQAPAPASPAKP